MCCLQYCNQRDDLENEVSELKEKIGGFFTNNIDEEIENLRIQRRQVEAEKHKLEGEYCE